MWSPVRTSGIPLITPVISHTKAKLTQTLVPTTMICISCITCFLIVVNNLNCVFIQGNTTSEACEDKLTIQGFQANDQSVILTNRNVTALIGSSIYIRLTPSVFVTFTSCNRTLNATSRGFSLKIENTGTFKTSC